MRRGTLRLIVAMALAVAAVAAQEDAARVQLEAVWKTRELDGDLAGAIKQYQAIADRYRHHAAIAAEALVRMAECHGKLGQREAERAAYERVMREYPNQPAAATARARVRSRAGTAPRAAGTPAPALTPTQLTFNSPEMPVATAAISRDGRSLAYVDTTGLRIQALPSGEQRRVPLPSGDDVEDLAWLPDASLLVASARGVWRIPPAGGAPRQLTQVGGPLGVSPDGSRMTLSVDSRRAILLFTTSGAAAGAIVPREADTTLSRAAWSPDGRRIVYARYASSPSQRKVTIETVRIDGTGRTIVQTGPVHDLTWSADGRVLFARPAPPPRGRYADLWAVAVDSASGQPRGEPAPVVVAPDYTFRRPSATADGKQLAFTVVRHRPDVFVAAFDPERRELRDLRRAVHGVTADLPLTWAPGGETILFQSQQAEASAIYRQPIDGRDPTVVFPSSKWPWDVVYTPDGTSMLYLSLRRLAVMRTPVGGGGEEALLPLEARPHDAMVKCSRPPSRVCVVGEHVGGRLRLTPFDPRDGTSRQPAELPAAPSVTSWDLSPDGTEIVSIETRPAESRLVVLNLETRGVSSVAVSADFAAWTADATGWIVTRAVSPRGSEVIFVDRRGESKVLWTSTFQRLSKPTISSDGRRIAFGSALADSNVWMVRTN